jgi:hypothetical protein
MIKYFGMFLLTGVQRRDKWGIILIDKNGGNTNGWNDTDDAEIC